MPDSTLRSRHEFRYDRWCGWLLGLLGMGRRSSEIVVDRPAGTVEVTMGWAFRATVPFGSLASVQPDDGLVLGWGVHGWRGRWLVNGSSRGLIRVRIEPPAPARVCWVPVRLRELRVSVERRSDLLAVLGQLASGPQDRW